MKICAVQTKPHRGDVRANLRDHLRALHHAARLGADAVIFPELSLTGYEPALAHTLAAPIGDSRLDPLQAWADAHGVTIGAGVPTPAPDGVRISMALFQPHAPRRVYSKQLLHDDERPYFVEGQGHAQVRVGDVALGFGICYEALQRAHIAQAVEQGADVYIASVAKHQRGVERAHAHFAQSADAFTTPILMANSVGPCDDFVSAGQSAAWSATGARLCALDTHREGVVVYDTARQRAAAHALTVERAVLAEVDALFDMYQRGRRALDARGIYQWTDAYPTRAIVEGDVRRGILHALKLGPELIGAVHLSEEQDAEYSAVRWAMDDPAPLVVHRLVVDPAHQRLGYAGRLMAFAEAFAQERGYASVRLDVYSQNMQAIALYTRRGYVPRGDVRFHGRAHPFHCMEKALG